MGRVGQKLPLSSLFMLLLVLSSTWCPLPVHGWFEIYFDLITVYVMNDLAPYTTLNLHCKSKDDDLGEHKLAHGQNFNWTFHINFWQTTLYWCSMWWYDSNGQVVQGTFDIYKARRDYARKCRSQCCWFIRKDGLYLGVYKGDAKLMFHWPK
ncbi:Plant self-incompatibility S1 [Macleaya cordata]|uniref:S-protein homolog n=1 Tax=Macleaya cordata TaxID=56857 RepID=A0A200R785_MACCD|nr:Plant self-incompatibility S1 [Macleaya cordata]